MDKFTKTTEVDTSDTDLLEEEPPKKSKIGKVVALIISLLLAVAIWLYVVETDMTVVEKDYSVSVTLVGTDAGYNITAEDVTITVKGTTSQLVDIDKSDIVVKVDIGSLGGDINAGKRCADAYVSIVNDGDGNVKFPESVKVILNIVEK